MIRTLIIVSGTTLALSASANAQTSPRLWLNQLGTADNERANALAPDGSGGAIVAGFTEGDLGGSSGDRDAFLARFTGTGSLLWLSQFGTNAQDDARAIIPDGLGGVYVAGHTHGDMYGSFLGGREAWLARYDSNGNELWGLQLGTPGEDEVVALASDGSGGVFVAGTTDQSLAGTSAGGIDIFLAHYDVTGSQQWIHQLGTAGDDLATALVSDGVGGTIVAGSTTGDLRGTNAGGLDVIMARHDFSGTQLWIQQFGTPRDDWAIAGATDSASGIILGGASYGRLNGPNFGDRDAFVSRYDENGGRVWLEQFGTLGTEEVTAMFPDGSGGAFISGWTGGSLGGQNPSPGLADVFYARFSGAGDQEWIDQFGLSPEDQAYALTTDDADGLFIAGWTWSGLNGIGAGGADIFVARYEQPICYADCDQSTGARVLDIFDFLCFQSSFVNSQPYACDCDTSTGVVCDVFDFLCFQNAYSAGCP